MGKTGRVSGSATLGTLGGIGLGVTAYGLFSVHDASIKYLVETLPIWQVLFFRSIAITLACVAIGRTGLLARTVASPVKGALLARGALTLAAWFCYFTASRSLELAQMTALYFAAPVMVTLMAAPMLGERVTGMRWFSVGLGFLGVLLASNPGTVSASLPSLLVLIAAACWGYGVILMRQIARRETSLLQMLIVNLFFSVATGIACLVAWVPMTWNQIGLITIVVTFGGLAQYILFESIRHAPASVMATVEYTGLVWAFVLGFLIWGEIPKPQVFGGAALILSAGALLVITEKRRALKFP